MIGKHLVNERLALSVLLIFALGSLGNAAEPPDSTAAKESVRKDRLGDPIPKHALLRFGTSRFRQPSIVIDLALSPDQKTVVTIGRQDLIAWDAETGKQRWRVDPESLGIDLNAASYGVRALAFAPDGEKFYTPGKPNEVFIWDTLSGENDVLVIDQVLPAQIFNLLLSRRPGNTRSVDVTSDGKQLAVGSAHGLIVCDQQGKVLFSVGNSPAKQVASAEMNRDRLNFGGHYSYGRFSPDGKVLAVVLSESPQEIRLLDAESGDELRRISTTARPIRFAFSSDGKYIAVTERNSAVRLYAIGTAEELWSYKIELKNKAESYTSAIAFSPDGKTIAACAPVGSDYLIHLLDAVDGTFVAKLEGHTWKPWTVDYSSDGKTIYSSGWDGVIRRWDAATNTQLPLPAGVRATGVVAVSPDGKVLAYADDSGTIHLVDSPKADEIRTLSLPGTKYSQLAFSPDNLKLAGGGTSGENVHVAIWNLANGDVLDRWDWPKGDDPHSDVEGLKFAPNGKYLAAAVHRQDAAYLWDLSTNERSTQMNHQEVNGVSFSPDSKTLVTVGWDSLIQFWDTEYGELDDVVMVESEESNDTDSDLRIWTASFSPAGGLLATAHLDDSIRIWQVDGMQLCSRFKMQGIFRYGAMTFSPDGLWIAAGTSRGCASLWDPVSGELVWDGGCHQAAISTVGFGHDSQMLVSGASDGIGYLWDTKPSRNRLDDDLEYLWNALSIDGVPAYEAMWGLVEMPDQAVEMLSEKLHSVERLIDLEHIPAGSSADEVEKLRVRNENLIEQEQTVERTVTARRALSVLSQIGSPVAIELLQELSERKPAGELGRLAKNALVRAGAAEQQ